MLFKVFIYTELKKHVFYLIALSIKSDVINHILNVSVNLKTLKLYLKSTLLHRNLKLKQMSLRSKVNARIHFKKLNKL